MGRRKLGLAHIFAQSAACTGSISLFILYQHQTWHARPFRLQSLPRRKGKIEALMLLIEVAACLLSMRV